MNAAVVASAIATGSAGSAKAQEIVAAQVPPQQIAPAFRKIRIDASSNLGAFKSLRGVNAGPLPWSKKLGIDRPGEFIPGNPEHFVEVSDRTGFRPLGADVSDSYRLAAIDLVRTHDNYGPGDIYADFKSGWEMADGTKLSGPERSAMVMFPNMQADPANPPNYNFGPTDELIYSIRAISARVLFRLGESAGSVTHTPKYFTTEAEYDHYAAIAKHVVMHYNKGWAHGFNYGIKYWEVSNEPEGTAAIPADKYFKLYGKVALAVKSVDANYQVGGPSFCRPYDGPEYREGFLQYLQRKKLPLDFMTFHWYAFDSNDPYGFVVLGNDMRKLLDDNGFKKTKLFLDEWSSGILPGEPATLTAAGRAAFTATSLIYMQDSPIDEQNLYVGLNLFGEDGKSPDKTGQVLIAWGRMKDTPVRLDAQGGDTNGFAVQAGRSEDGLMVNVLISNYEIPPAMRGPRKNKDKLYGLFTLQPRRNVVYEDNAGFDVAIEKLDADRDYSVERYRISDVWDFRLLSTIVLKGKDVRVAGALPAPGIEFIVVRPVVNQH